MAVVAISTAIIVFGSLSQSTDQAITSVMPQIETSTDTIALSGKTSNAVAVLGAASTEAERRAAEAVFEQSVAALSSQVDMLPEAAVTAIAPVLQQLRTDVGEMNAAISRRIEIDAAMDAQLSDLRAFADDLNTQLRRLEADAKADLRSGGTKTVEKVQSALESITGEQLTRLQDLLNARAELGLAVGASAALINATDSAQAVILSDMAQASSEKLRSLLESLNVDPAYAGELSALETVDQMVTRILERSGRVGPAVKAELLSAQTAADNWLVEAIDTLSFALIITAEDVAASNESAIEDLLGSEVNTLSTTMALAAIFKQVVIAAQNVAVAETPEELEAMKGGLDGAIFNMVSHIQWNDFPTEMKERLNETSALTRPETGLLAVRSNLFAAREEAESNAEQAYARAEEIANLALSVGRQSASDMRQAGAGVTEQASSAQERLWQLSGIMLVVGLVALAIAWAWVVRPLQLLTAITERLSSGDLQPVNGFDRSGGEIGRMAGALKVFRDGLIERQEMREQEKQREKEEREAEQRRIEERKQAERLEAERQAEAEAAERAREEEAREKEAAAQRVAEQEREARMQEQDAVVSQLANGLEKLSEGDLTVAITQAFPEAYEGLRHNFNDAIETLSELIGQLTETASRVNSSSQDVAASADEMARRTERNAASLEETSAAVLELDATAKSTSSAAQEVNGVMGDARTRAEKSRKTVTSAVATMSDIEESSTAISKIVDMIEEIAFQTNLLALNAGVEAARAGEEGRGFGVVAGEVRALAQRSSEAASEINNLISATRDQISRGVAEVGDAGDALNGILTLIGDISDHVSGISNAAQEQSVTISEISTSVNRIEAETQKNSATSEEALAASEMLKREAGALDRLSERFQTRSEAGVPLDDQSAA